MACLLSAVATAFLASCSESTGGPDRLSQGPTGIHELTSLYELAATPHPASVRKPIRDERNRAMRLLAEKSEAFLAATADWINEARLTGLNEPQRECVQNDVRQFRQALQGLGTAAQNADVPRVKSEYTAVIELYRHLQQHVGDTPPA